MLNRRRGLCLADVKSKRIACSKMCCILCCIMIYSNYRRMGYEMQFDWDDEKEKYNIEKHGIDFSTAALVFGDIHRIEKYDELHSDSEDRYITIGQINGVTVVVMVVYTMRKTLTRIISARLATKREKEAYYNAENY